MKDGRFARNTCDEDFKLICNAKPILTADIKEAMKPYADYESAMCCGLLDCGFKIEYDDEIEISIDTKESCNVKFVLKFVGKFSYVGVGNKFVLYEETTDLFEAVRYRDRETAEWMRKDSKQYCRIADKLEVKEVHVFI